jgi:hypothetical protein
MAEDFQLFTSLRYDPILRQPLGRVLGHETWNWAHSSPLYMLDYHRDRMLRAATYWGWDAAVKVLSGDDGLRRLVDFIMDHVGETQTSPMKVRISITRDGELDINYAPVPKKPLANFFPKALPVPGPEEPRDGDAGQMIPSKSLEYEVLVDGRGTTRSEYTHFKTTKRAMYDGARQRAQINLPDMKEVLIVSETNGAVMEGSVTTPYFWREGRWVTPVVSKEYSLEKGSGGQNGTSRRWALERYVSGFFPGQQNGISNTTQWACRRRYYPG